MSLKNPVNDAFKKEWLAYVQEHNLPGGDKRVTNDPMEATYVGMHIWKQAVEKAGTTDVDKVIAAAYGQKFNAPCGFEEEMDPNHHLHKPVMIGEIRRGRPIQRCLEDKGYGPCPALEPVHSGQRKQARPRFQRVAARFRNRDCRREQPPTINR